MKLGGLLCVFALGCAHGELIAFPPTGSGESDEVSPATPDTEEHAAPRSMRMRFSTHAPPDGIRSVACGLHPSLSVGGEKTRPVDIRVDSTACSPPIDGALHASVEIATDEVVVRLQVPDGTTAEALPDLEQGLREIESELARRIAALPRPVPPLIVPAPAEKTSRSKKWFIASAVVGAIGLGALAVAGTMAGVGAANKNNGLESTGDAILGSFAAPLGVATLVTLTIGAVLLIGGD